MTHHRKAMTMNSHSRTLVHQLLASQLHIDERSIDDELHFEELGIDPLDLVLVVLRLEDVHRGQGEFPIAALEGARTVDDLVLLVDIWLQPDTVPDSSEGPDSQRAA
jgi:acyl carrier protein